MGKKYFSLFCTVFLMMFFLCACSDDNTPILEVSYAGGEVTAQGATVKIMVKSNTDWAVLKEDDWIKLNQEVGNGDATVTVNVDPNPGEQRNAVITFSAGSVNKPITIVQAGANNSNKYNIKADVDALVVDSDQRDGKIITLTTDAPDWEYINTEDWILVTKNGNQAILTFNKLHTGYRSAKISFGGKNFNTNVDVIIHQAVFRPLSNNICEYWGNIEENNLTKSMMGIQDIDKNGNGYGVDIIFFDEYISFEDYKPRTGIYTIKNDKTPGSALTGSLRQEGEDIYISGSFHKEFNVVEDRYTNIVLLTEGIVSIEEMDNDEYLIYVISPNGTILDPESGIISDKKADAIFYKYQGPTRIDQLYWDPTNVEIDPNQKVDAGLTYYGRRDFDFVCDNWLLQLGFNGCYFAGKYHSWEGNGQGVQFNINVERGQGKEYLPEGKYYFDNYEDVPGTFSLSTSLYIDRRTGKIQSENLIRGEVDVSREGDAYTITFDVTSAKNVSIKGTYTGPIKYTDNTAPYKSDYKPVVNRSYSSYSYGNKLGNFSKNSRLYFERK